MKKSLMFALMAALACGAAYAGTSGAEFEALYNMVENWATGYLGRAIALIFLLVGLGVGIIRGSIVGAISCIAAAMSFLIAPTVVSGILTAVI